MSKMRVWGRIFWLVAFLSAGLLHPAASYGQEEPPAPAYGPQLFLFSPAAGQEGALAALTLTLHASLYMDEGPDRLLASGPAELSAAAAAAGIPAELLDGDTTGKAYYFADAQAEGATELAAQFGAIRYADRGQLLLAVDLANEQAMLEALPAAGVSVALLPPEGLPLPAEGGAESAAAEPAAAAAIPAPNPAVAALLAQVDPAELRTRIAQLSGMEPIDAGGSSVTLKTRYTFASNVRTVEAAVFRQYQLLGYAPAFSNWTYGNYSGRNVVAELRGAVHPERVWIVGGHFDSNSNAPYSSAPGADDNATGTAATLAIARILKEQRFADTVRFVQFGGEEQGKWGSIAYARNVMLSGTQVVGFIDLDMFGWDGNGDRVVEIHSGTRANSIAFSQRFLDANSRYSQELRIELKKGTASRFSDHASFWDQGYAAFLTIENFFDDTLLRDRNPYYHNTGDILSRVDLDYVTRITRTALAMLGDGAGLLPSDGATPTPTPTLTLGPTNTPTVTPTPGACVELIANGGFEANASWAFGSTATKGSYSTAQARAGARSVRLGISPSGAPGEALPPEGRTIAPTGERNLLGELAPDAASYSSVYQTISVPSSAARVTLTFWRRPGSEGAGGDFQRGLLLRPGSYALIATIFKELATSDWRQMSYDLTPYRGQSVVVYFEVYNDNTSSGPRAWMHLDDVSAQACPTVAPAPTATATPTPTVVPGEAVTPAPTPSVTPTATAQPLACEERIANGGFEATGGWTFAVTGNPGGYASGISHEGSRSARLGVAPSGDGAGSGEQTGAERARGPERNLLGELAPEGASYSSVYQTVSLPDTAQSLTLRYWHWTGTDATAGNGDFQRVLLLRPGSYALLKVLSKSLSNTGEWRRAEFDLSPYAGQSVVVYFETYNDNTAAAPRAWLRLDDVAVTMCVESVREMGGGFPLWLPMVLQ